jgi:hypothetical protein
VRTGAVVKRTVVLFPGALGDAVCFEPTARRLAQDGALLVYARGAAAEVMGLFPRRPEVRSLDRPEVARLFAPLGEREESDEAPAWLAAFDRVVSFTGSHSREVLARLSRLPHAIVAPFPRQPGAEHASDEFLRAATGERCAVASPPELLPPEPRPVELGAREAILALHPGSGGAAKRAPLAIYEEIARRWRSERSGRVRIVLGPAESGEAQRWSGVGDEIVLPRSVAALAAALASAGAYLGNDSGPTHVAAALGLCGLALFTTSEPQRFGPRSRSLRVLRLAAGDPLRPADDDAHAVWSALSGALP